MLLEAAENFLMGHMTIKSEFIPGKMARVDKPDYAPRAVREAMVNAICHRSYSHQSGSISLTLYDDKLEVTSPGKLVNGVHIDDLKRSHDSHPRNNVITHVMYRRGIIEAVGTGTQEIVKETRAIGKPEPCYIERGNTFVVSFSSKIQKSFEVRQNRIIDLLRAHGAMQKSDIVVHIGVEVSERTLYRDLKQLAEIDVVEMVEKGRNVVWRLKGD